MNSLSVLHLSESDTPGGAPRAGYRLHRALAGAGVDSRMWVGEKRSGDHTVEERSPGGRMAGMLDRLRGALNRRTARLADPENPAAHYTGWMGRLSAKEINRSSADLVHLQWFHGPFLSVRQIGRIRKPAVWTLHDMWAFCGAEHYAPDEEGARWRNGYSADSREGGGPDVNRWTWRRKKRHWRRPIQIVTPSRWLGECVSRSALMGDWPVSVIPYALDLETFRPWPRELARDILGLPKDPLLVLFGAWGGSGDDRKGWDLLARALPMLGERIEEAEGVIFGQDAPRERPDLGLPLHYMGHLHDAAALALLYSAADLMAVPSRQDNLPQTGIEAQACGCPVAAFRVAGMPDVLEDGVTGRLAEPFSSESLAEAMAWMLEDPERRRRLGEQSRERARKLWSPDGVARRYRELYRELLEQREGDA